MAEPQPMDCDDTPKLTAEEWAYIEALPTSELDGDEEP